MGVWSQKKWSQSQKLSNPTSSAPRATLANAGPSRARPPGGAKFATFRPTRMRSDMALRGFGDGRLWAQAAQRRPCLRGGHRVIVDRRPRLLQPASIGKAAGVDWGKADLLDETRHECLGIGVIARDE